MENVSVNPRTALSQLATDGGVQLRVIPRDRVGGDSMDIDDSSSAIPPHPGRRRVDPQPAASHHPNQHPSSSWWCKAIGEQEGTGKAIGKWMTEEARAKPTGKRFAPTLEREPRSKRAAAPSNLQLECSGAGPSSDQARAGPGRGRTFEPAAASKSSTIEAILEEPIEILAAPSRPTGWPRRARES
eukprot:4493991-Prymnesium_polylepis.1